MKYKTNSEVEKEFTEMLVVHSENDSLYDKGGVQEWLKANSEKHLYENSIYGEPICDLSSDKVLDFITSTRIKDLEAIKEWVENLILETTNDERYDGYDLCQKHVLTHLSTLIEKNK